ncbi:MAG: right-handed parallel beta-helix repeat-containing protein [Bryobacteraceae bacterium]|nr:right-handed parallel beta-helix repeat-containing protein [Bryobacteraceae bacterium]
MIRITGFLLALAPGLAWAATPESALREAFTRRTGEIRLPPGTTVLTQPLEISAEAHDLVITGVPGTVLRASGKFTGRALIHVRGGTRIAMRGFTIDGNRAALAKPLGMPPSNQPFHRFYENNGIVAEGVTELVIEEVALREVANLAILVSHSRNVRVRRIRVTDSGSLNEKRRNNTTGGILLEEGTKNFEVTNSYLLRVRGNGIWTHSLYTSPRNEDGRISGNDIRYSARDAIQVGHATRVKVKSNTGRFIGYPSSEVDIENEGWPVAIDTAGNVDQSSYALNTFEELNGKCIDLDGFHHGEIRRNRCVNTKPPAQYPYGHYGIVMNNSNPDMESEKIVIIDNELEGMKFGGIFVIGTGHRIEKNRMRNLNMSGCPETQGKVACVYDVQQPDLLQSGIYLGLFVDPKRRSPAMRNIIVDNLIMGHGMKTRCLVFAPGLANEGNEVARNICLEPPAAAPQR